MGNQVIQMCFSHDTGPEEKFYNPDDDTVTVYPPFTQLSARATVNIQDHDLLSLWRALATYCALQAEATEKIQKENSK